MTKPELSNLASIAEIGAALVVVISIFFIYEELEQNTLSTQDASYQQFLSNLTELDLAEASDPDLARISSTADANPQELSDSEWIRFSRLASARVAQIEYAYLSRINGTMNDSHWQAVEPHMQYLFCLPGYKLFLDSGMEQIFASSFLQHLESEIYPNCK